MIKIYLAPGETAVKGDSPSPVRIAWAPKGSKLVQRRRDHDGAKIFETPVPLDSNLPPGVYTAFIRRPRNGTFAVTHLLVHPTEGVGYSRDGTIARNWLLTPDDLPPVPPHPPKPKPPVPPVPNFNTPQMDLFP